MRGNLHNHVNILLVAGKAVELDDVGVVQIRLYFDFLEEATCMFDSLGLLDDFQSDDEVEVTDTRKHNVAVYATAQLSEYLKSTHFKLLETLIDALLEMVDAVTDVLLPVLLLPAEK